MRLGHSGLNSTLHLIGKHQSGLCEQCQVPETVEHVIMDCSIYDAEREMMRTQMRDLGVQHITLEGLLEMGNRRQVKVLLVFLRASGVFDRI